MYSIDNDQYSDIMINKLYRNEAALMAEQKQRKTDRRTLYTRMVIKEAMLELLTEMDYSELTVADICRQAEINRGTFYLHYDNISQVLDALFDDALGNTHSVLAQIGSETAKDEKCAYPLCRFLRENKKYQPLFFSDSLHSYVVDRMAESYRRSFVERLQKESGLGEETLNALFYFQLNGCLAISKRNIAVSDDAWSEIQCSVDRFLKHGFENL